VTHRFLRRGVLAEAYRRIHSTQYSSHPKVGFAQVRQQSPEQYESYGDLEAGAQPCLSGNHLKLGYSSGGVALKIGLGAEGYFTGLRIHPPQNCGVGCDRLGVRPFSRILLVS
jgi:hypothetical protein